MLNRPKLAYHFESPSVNSNDTKNIIGSNIIGIMMLNRPALIRPEQLSNMIGPAKTPGYAEDDEKTGVFEPAQWFDLRELRFGLNNFSALFFRGSMSIISGGYFSPKSVI
jgi:hypothetical protein